MEALRTRAVGAHDSSDAAARPARARRSAQQPADRRTVLRAALLWLCAALLPVAARAAQVTVFSPQGTVRDVRQVAVRFSEPMVAFGDPRLPDPFVVDCAAAGTGRWADGRNWVYDFDADLAAGIACHFTLSAGLRTLAGAAVTGTTSFSFDTGGPAVRASVPGEGDSYIDADQVFILALDAPADPDSITAHAVCTVEGISEQIPVEPLAGKARAEILAQRRQLGYEYFTVLWKSGRERVEQVTSAALQRAEDELVVLRCRRGLPPETPVQLVWGAGIRTLTGIATTQDQTLRFRTRPAFTARVECERVNARASCLPMLPLRLVFSAPVPAARLQAVRLTDARGKDYPARAPPHAGDAPTLESLSFAGPFPEHTTLTLRLPDDLTDDAGRPLENAERFPLALDTDGYPPLAKFSGDFGILEAGAGGVLPLTLRKLEPDVPARRVSVPTAPDTLPAQTARIATDAQIADWLERVHEAMKPRGEWVLQPDGSSEWREQTGSESVFASGDATASFDVPMPAGEQPLQVVGIPLTRPGFYVVELASPRLGAALLGETRPRYVATTALVTNLAVHFEWGRESSLVWVTTLDEAQPVAAARIAISNYCSGASLWTGTTDGDGRARVAADLGAPHGGSECNEWAPAPLLVSARTDTDMSFTVSGWSQGIMPSDFRMPAGGAWNSEIAHTVFDRTLLRAGETVSMKHYLRRHEMAGFAIPDATAAIDRVEITHVGSGDKVTLPLHFDAAGIAESRWQIPPEAKLGDYQIVLTEHDEAKPQRRWFQSGSFRVEQFRVPTMTAVVQAPAGHLVRPEAVPLDIYVGYLSGGPDAHAPVTLRTVVEPRALAFPGYDDFSFGGVDVHEGIEHANAGADEDDPFAYYRARFGAYGASGGAQRAPAQIVPLTLDAQGTARASVSKLPPIDSPKSLVAELEYQDANGEKLAATTRVPLWSASIALGIRVEGWTGSRDKLRFQVVALDLDGRPRAEHAVDVALYAREYYSYRKRLIGGFYAYETDVRITRLAAGCSGHTDAHGLLLCELAPGHGGEVVLRAQARDDAGHEVIATTSAWVVGDGEWWFDPGNADRMDVLPEQREYDAGATARFQVRMPFRAATALVTVQREGVIDSFVTHLSGSEPVVEVSVDAKYAPNVYVSVLAVRGRIGWWGSLLATVARSLHLPWHFDGGFPSARVDLSKPAYRLGIARIAVGWTPHRLNVDVKPARETYEIRDTAQVDVDVKRADGGVLPAGAEIALAAVDEALLELKDNDSWALLARMMDERGLEVWTSTGQMQVVGKRHYGRKAVPHGGGGGRAPAREHFDTLLLWRGRVALDASGHAQVEVPLNDSLSSFRIVAVASASAGYFGTGQTTLRTTQDLMLHAGLPPLVRESDRFRAVVTARNASDRTMTVDASASYRTQASTAPVTIAPRNAELAPGAAQELDWELVVPVNAGTLAWDLAVTERGGKAADRLQVEQRVLPVYPVRTYQATLARIDDPLTLVAALPEGAVPGRGGVQVDLRARLGDELAGVREYMGYYSYACIEQELSKAVALEDRARWDAAVARLPVYLDSDGLLRYFPSAGLQGSDTLTAYVLAIAHEAGWDIPNEARTRMLDGLQGFVGGSVVRVSMLPTADLAMRKLAAIAALARYDAASADMLSSISIDPALWPTSAVLDWLAVLRRVDGIPQATTRSAQASQILRARLNFQGTVMSFSTEHNDALWWLMIDGDVNAVRAVLGLLHEAAWREDLPRMLRGALARQVRGHWSTTVANAWGVLAMRAFSAAFESTAVSGATQAAYAGATRAVQWSAVDAGAATVEFPWADAPAPLTVTHRGAGRPWAIVASRAALPLTQPLFTGYAIARSIEPVEQATPGVWTRGDVARVILQLQAQSDMGWVVVDDPVPAGASILGTGLGRDAQLLTQDERRTGWVYPAYEERRFDAFRAYYRFVPKGEWTVEYTVRLNTPGTFMLPATRVEAMYAPEMYGELPNAPLEVVAR